MFLSINKLPNNIRQGDKPDPKAAQALQEGLGGQFGEMRTMMQYLFQNMNFRGDATPYKDLLRSIATEEMGHVGKPTGSSRYAIGQKRCQICEIFLEWDGIWCPCCGNKVRTKPHAPHLRAKLLSSIPRSLH